MAQGFIKKAVTSTFSQLESKKNAIKEYCREKHISLKVEQKNLTSEFLLELFNTKKVHSIIGFNHSGNMVFQGGNVSKRVFQETDIDQLLVVTEVKELKSHFIQLLQVKLPELNLIQTEDNAQSHCKGNKGFLPLSSSNASTLAESTPMNDMNEQSELEELYNIYNHEEKNTSKNSLFI